MSVYRDKRQAGQWMAKFMVAGRVFTKKGFHTKKEAAAWEAEERVRAQNPPQKEGIDLTSFVSLAEKYLVDCQPRMIKNTVKYKSTHIARFIGWMKGDFDAKTLPRSKANDYINHVATTKGNIAANRSLKDLHALYAWAEIMELVQANPFHRIAKLPETKEIKYVPSPDEMNKVLTVADGDEMELIEFLYQTGARIGEAVNCSWKDVDFVKGELTLWTRKRKGGELESDSMPIGEALREVLEGRHAATGGNGLVFTMPERKRRKLMKVLCDRAGVPHFGFHCIRHHVASLIAESGEVTLRQLQIFLRHKNQSTTEIYVHELTRGQKEVTNILDFRRKKQASQDTNQDTNLVENKGLKDTIDVCKGA